MSSPANSYINFTISIKPEDMALWHKLAAVYHTDGVSSLRACADEQIAPKASPEPEGQKLGEASTSLYDFVVENCSCGKCWRSLANSSRVPWTTKYISGRRVFTNCKHGQYKPDQKCLVATAGGSSTIARGYIYEKEEKKVSPPKQGKVTQEKSMATSDVRVTKPEAVSRPPVEVTPTVKDIAPRPKTQPNREQTTPTSYKFTIHDVVQNCKINCYDTECHQLRCVVRPTRSGSMKCDCGRTACDKFGFEALAGKHLSQEDQIVYDRVFRDYIGSD
jgi:hypothetical protein